MSKKIVLCCLSLFFFLPVSATRTVVYEKAKLDDIRVELREFIEYETDTDYQHYDSSEFSNCKGRERESFSNAWVTSRSRPVLRREYSYFFKIRKNGLEYTTYFKPFWRDRIDTNWIIGRNVNMRFNSRKNRLYIQKPSGGELKTKIIRVEPV